MIEKHVTITEDQREEVLSLIRKLPSILAGTGSDVAGIQSGMKTRVGYTILKLILPNFNNLGRGQAGVDGDRWAPLSRHYLAYGRRFGPNEEKQLKQRAGLTGSNRLAPGGNKGLLTPDQLKLWRRTYADRLAYYIMRESDAKAKAHAAAVAWIVVKRAGAKTKLDVYGNRQVQILVDEGRLRNSLTPGVMQELGAHATLDKPSGKGGREQELDLSTPSQIIVGTNVEYAKYHHNGRGRRRRRLWPKEFPQDWLDQITSSIISGLVHIGDLFASGGKP